MKTIPPSLVEETWNYLADAEQDEITDEVAEFHDEQPAITAFLDAAEKSSLREEDQGMFTFYGLWIWLSFKEAGAEFDTITGDTLAAALAQNHADLGSLDLAGDAQWMAQAAKMTKSYNQMPMLAGLMQLLTSDMEDGEERAEDAVGLSILHLKTVIDCLDRMG
jgi:hypothetical protein